MVEKGRTLPTVWPMLLMAWPALPPTRSPATPVAWTSHPHSPAGTAMRSPPPPGLAAWPWGPAPLGMVEKGRTLPTVWPMLLMAWPGFTADEVACDPGGLGD